MTTELEQQIRAEFEQFWNAEEGKWLTNAEAFQVAYIAGRASVLDGLEQVGAMNPEGEVSRFTAPRYPRFTTPIYRLSPQLQEENEKK